MKSDFYPTPLSAFIPLLPFLPKSKLIWEPACGDGRLIEAMQKYGLRADGNDIKTGYDFLKDREMTYECILTNPPFSLALEFCKHAFDHALEAFLLLRLNFLASQKRRAWFSTHEPNALFVLSTRPKFVNNRTDHEDYAWFYWGAEYKGIFHL